MQKENLATPCHGTKRLILYLSDNNEFFNEAADYAVVELGTEEIRRIRQLSAAARDLGVYRISEFNHSCDFRAADYDVIPGDGKIALVEFRGRMECCTLNISDDDFYWSGLYRNTSVRWETDSVPLTALDDDGDLDQREAYHGNGLREGSP